MSSIQASIGPIAGLLQNVATLNEDWIQRCTNFRASWNPNPKTPETGRWRAVEAVTPARVPSNLAFKEPAGTTSLRRCYGHFEGVRTQLPFSPDQVQAVERGASWVCRECLVLRIVCGPALCGRLTLRPPMDCVSADLVAPAMANLIR